MWGCTVGAPPPSDAGAGEGGKAAADAAPVDGADAIADAPSDASVDAPADVVSDATSGAAMDGSTFDGEADASDADASEDATVVGISLPPFDFSLVPCGSSTTAPFLVPNADSVPVHLHAETSAPFAVSPSDVTVDAGGSASLTLTVTVPSGATAGAPLVGLLSLSTPDGDAGLRTAALSVTPSGATLIFDPDLPTAADFGAWPVGVAATPALIEMRNVGNRSVSVALGTPADTAFTVSSQPNAPATIDSIGAAWPSTLPVNQDSMTLDVTVGFTAAALGAHASAIPVTTTGVACGTSVTSIPLSGRGASAGIVYGWAAPDFDLGDTYCGSSPSATFTLTNSGTADVTLTSVIFDEPGYTANVGAGAIVPAGGSLAITVIAPPIPFPSPIPATYASLLSITTDVPGDAVHQTVVFAHAQGAIVQWALGTPDSISFDGTPYNTTATRTVNLQNLGNVRAPLGTTETGPFGGVGNNAPPPADEGLVPFSSEIESITYQPTSAAEVTGSLSLQTATPGVFCAPLPPPLLLAGSGAASGIVVSSPFILACVDCSGLNPRSAALTITNAGATEAAWTVVAPPGFQLDVTGGDLASGASVTINVSPPPFPAPTSPFLGQSTLTVGANFGVDGGSPPPTDGGAFDQTVAVQVLQQVAGCFVSNVPNVDFGDVAVGSFASQEVGAAQITCGCGGTSSTAGELLGAGAPFVVEGRDITGGWTIGFEPEVAGPAQATFSYFFFSGGAGPFCGTSNATVTVTGTGVQ